MSAALQRQLLDDADLCVKCGLCLPHCPTYGLSQQEGDSPRGRIALLQGLAGGKIALTPKLETHLDGCLACRACESVCPAHVPYGDLLDNGRAFLAQQKPQRTRMASLIAAVFTQAWLRTPLSVVLWLYQRSGMQALIRRTHLLGRGRLARLESLMPRADWPRALNGSNTGAQKPVALFTGCTGTAFDRPTLEATVTLLSSLGYPVQIPPAQTCCGAMHQHSGLSAGAQTCATRNRRAFEGTAPVIGIASGCTAQLSEDGDAGFAGRVRDIHAFLAGENALKRAAFDPLPLRVALHLPCTLRNVLKGSTALREALAAIPQLQVMDLDPSQRCCGAAGSHFITHPGDADALLEPKLESVRRLKPDVVLSANIGCSMHLAAGLRRAGLTAPVLHPVQLLAQQVQPASAGARPTAA